MRRGARLLAALAAPVLLLGGCASSPESDGPGEAIADAGNLPDAVPRKEPRSRYGNPPSYEVFGQRYHVLQSADGFTQRGVASWYGRKFHGRRTSSGEPYDMYAMTAAHKRLPLPSWVEVTNLDNGRTTVVKVNDRGPFAKGRIIDLSYAAASKLGVVAAGTAPVELRVVAVAGPAAGGDGDAPPSADTAAAGDGELYLQVGAFGERANARRVLNDLRDGELGAPVRLFEAEHRGRPLYRVRVGPLPDPSLVERLGGRLTAMGYPPGHVVSEP
ncbi:septal ring lytic transglycosylase RlpA family protein [Arhodomonas sp. SL1]|uniref:septal ring lytic transglycosylase RlpA family protein n=1 Tax=Arhodomonas sp. SL1 TaxID=3425691 RepID=UPI003F882D83